ncbi:MAG: hypothetical protein ACOYMN_04930 [Roseimicrobium sp.]
MEAPRPTPQPPWPHAPPHRLSAAGAFMVTAGTYGKVHLFTDGPGLRMLHDALLTVANPVRHGIVPVANLHPHGSAAWFERTAELSFVRTVYSFKMDALNVQDEF